MVYVLFFFKQKTAYEMRISDWSSDVCSSDLPTFAPRGTNANFIQPAGPSRLRIRTYERGVEAETLACGTGAVASGLIAFRLGLAARSEARCVGKEGVSTCRSRSSPTN